MNFRQLAENLGLEEDEFLELAGIFVDTSGSDLSRLQSAIDEENVQKVLEAAHSIKGASGNMGFMEISSVAKEIEDKARDNRLEGIAESAQVLKKGVGLIAEALIRSEKGSPGRNHEIL